MASSSLGTLTLDLIARIGGFTGPLDRASRESQKRMAEIKKAGEQIGAGIALGVTAGITAITALTISAANAGSEITKFAQVSGSSTTEFQKMAFGAKAMGIEQDKLADIFKDVNDKVGDFLSTGGGELQDFFTNIAPKVGVTSEQFRGLSGPQALGLFASSLEKAGVSQAQFTFYMEAIANDATLLIPLLKNGGEGFRKLGDMAASAGAIMDEKTIKATQELSAALMIADTAISGLKNQIAVALLPVLADFAGSLSNTSVNGATASQVAETLVGSMKVLAATALSVVAAFELTGKAIGGFVALSARAFEGVNWKDIALGPVGVGYAMSKNFKGIQDMAVDVGGDLEATGKKYKSFFNSIMDAGSGTSSSKSKELAALLAQLREAGDGKGTTPALTSAQNAAVKAAEAAAKKIQTAFDTSEEGYQRQIELINTTTDAQNNATEVAKLAFEITSGKLVGINAQQQKRLDGLATELDRLQKIKQANEDAKKLAAFGANLSESNQTAKDGFDLQLAGAGQGDKYKDRLKETLSIQQDFNKQMRDLQVQHNSGEISQSLYDSETEKISEALAERLVLQQDYYNQVDEAQSQWMDGVSSAWQNYVDDAENYSQQAADFVSGSLGDLTSNLGDAFASIADGSKNIGDAFADMAGNMAQSVLKALSDMAAQWLVYQAIQLLVGKTTQSSAGLVMVSNAEATSAQAALAAYASTAAIPLVGPAMAPAAALAATAATAPMVAAVATSALAGMAHDGMSSIPKEGTWLLDGGERIVTPEQNKDLTRFLNQSGNSQASTSAPQISISAPITVQAQQGVSDQDAQRQGQQMSQAFTAEVVRILQGEMNQGGVLWRK